ncbi:1,4-dihydroxy-2-naphthoate polyprenyltransferase [Thermoanaerobacterium thermosaccharolyticum]|uniref:1,4-dihydroxy-2-naphthoate polyprenyltransferase n=1 Tax=Thermoanaerobacterium thermosaccharolyticum TaxID=1517 RepID=UPI003DAA3DD7
MNVKSFLKLVEIQTKAASVTPFALGTVYALFAFHDFKLVNFLLMLLSLLSFDMATTAINNYMDYKKANKTHGYNYEKHNAIVRDNLSESSVVATIIVLLLIASTAGFILFLRTNVLVLLIGMASFAVGILYSFGPIPISRMPLGEIFSGFFMGFVIVFLSVFIHVYDKNIAYVTYSSGIFNVWFDVFVAMKIFFISLPAVMGIANIMLANNICDIEDDLENRRYTLPIYIGKEKALKLFKALYYISYIDIVVLVILKVLPLLALIVLLTFVPINKNIKEFYKVQTKKDTFPLSVKNFLMMNVAEIITIGLGLLH